MIHKELTKYLAEHNATLTLYPNGSGRCRSGRSAGVSETFETVNELTALVRSRELTDLKKDLEEARQRVRNLESRHLKLCYSDPVPQPDLSDTRD